MALHQHKCLKSPGLPEVTGLLLMGVAVAFASLWWRENAAHGLWEVTGKVIDASAQLTHYNAVDVLPKVNVQYEYAVGQRTFVGAWTGFWPQVVRKNSMLRADGAPYPVQGQTLPVFYDPDNPSASVLLLPDKDGSLAYGLTTAAGFALCALYCCKVYPAWRRKW